MNSKLATIRDVVLAFGGPAELGQWCGINANAVSNWMGRGEIPPCWHLRLILEARRRGFEIDPVVFGLEGDDASDLTALSALAAQPDPAQQPAA